jgi:hypothetical protein
VALAEAVSAAVGTLMAALVVVAIEVLAAQVGQATMMTTLAREIKNHNKFKALAV